jgi:hypothetical protein
MVKHVKVVAIMRIPFMPWCCFKVFLFRIQAFDSEVWFFIVGRPRFCSLMFWFHRSKFAETGNFGYLFLEFT